MSDESYALRQQTDILVANATKHLQSSSLESEHQGPTAERGQEQEDREEEKGKGAVQEDVQQRMRFLGR